MVALLQCNVSALKAELVCSVKFTTAGVLYTLLLCMLDLNNTISCADVMQEHLSNSGKIPRVFIDSPTSHNRSSITLNPMHTAKRTMLSQLHVQL